MYLVVLMYSELNQGNLCFCLKMGIWAYTTGVVQICSMSLIGRGITGMAKYLVFPLFLSTLITILNLFTSKISKTTQF